MEQIFKITTRIKKVEIKKIYVIINMIHLYWEGNMYKLNGVMYSAEEIKNKVKELAKQIESDYAGEELLVVGILKGAQVMEHRLLHQEQLR